MKTYRVLILLGSSESRFWWDFRGVYSIIVLRRDTCWVEGLFDRFLRFFAILCNKSQKAPYVSRPPLYSHSISSQLSSKLQIHTKHVKITACVHDIRKSPFQVLFCWLMTFKTYSIRQVSLQLLCKILKKHHFYCNAGTNLLQ